jgi:hypothetical protein
LLTEPNGLDNLRAQQYEIIAAIENGLPEQVTVVRRQEKLFNAIVLWIPITEDDATLDDWIEYMSGGKSVFCSSH